MEKNTDRSANKLTSMKERLAELRKQQTEARLEFEAARQKLLDAYREKLKDFQKQRAEIYAAAATGRKTKNEAKPAKAKVATKKVEKTEKALDIDQPIQSEVVIPEVVEDETPKTFYSFADESAEIDQLQESLEKLAAM